MRRYSLGLVLFVTMATLVGALSGVQHAAGVPVGPTGNSDLHERYTPVFTPTACPVPVSATPRIDCGFVTVPEDRTHPQGAQVHLAVAWVHSPSPAGAASPVVRLEGGPGVGSLLTLGTGPAGSPLLPAHDLVLFDQRGTGFSQPRLNCPEVDTPSAVNADRNEPFVVEAQAVLDALQQCRDRLTAEGVDVGAFDSVASADDVEDIRVALGFPSWSLYSVSYGTRLAQQVMRAHPDHIRAVILDSVVPTDFTAVDGWITATNRAFDVLFQRCAESPMCNAIAPNLAAQFAAIVADYNAHPQPLTLTDSQGGVHHISIDGGDLTTALAQLMRTTSLLPLIPLTVAPIAQHNIAILTQLAQLATSTTPVAVGTSYSVECRDRYQNVRFADVVKLIDANPNFGPFYEGVQATGCQTWDAGVLPRSFNKLIDSAIPTLIFAGEFDPVAPPSNGERVARQLANATFVEFKGTGHGVLRSNPCATALGVAFFADPTAPLDTSCVASVGEPF